MKNKPHLKVNIHATFDHPKYGYLIASGHILTDSISFPHRLEKKDHIVPDHMYRLGSNNDPALRPTWPTLPKELRKWRLSVSDIVPAFGEENDKDVVQEAKRILALHDALSADSDARERYKEIPTWDTYRLQELFDELTAPDEPEPEPDQGQEATHSTPFTVVK